MKATPIALLITLSVALGLAVAACDGSSDPSAPDTAAPADIAPAPDAVAVDDTAPDVPREPPWEFAPPTAPWIPDVLAALPANAEGLVFDGAGGLFLSAMDGVVYRLDADGSPAAWVTLLPVDGAGGDVAGMARGPDGALYVCRYGAGRIERIHGDPPEVTIVAEGLDHPNSMAFDPAGALWYTASGAGAESPGHVGRFSPGGEAEVLLDDIVYANGLAFAPDHSRVWITSTDPGSLLMAPLGADGLPTGPAVVVADGPDLAVADGLAVAPDGTVFIAGFGTGKIYAWHDDALITVAAAEAPPGIAGVASLAFGAGPGFSGTALYATNLLQPKLFVIELGD
jgi:gluconolactonase